MAGCDAAVVVIGPRWMELLQERSQKQPPDYVRHEIEAALARKITVVPALVGGATMAQLTGLPESLAGLSFHQAAELRDSSFKEDCSRLCLSLGHTSPRWKWFAVAGVVLLLLGLAFAIGPGTEYRARKVALQRVMATARVQTDRTEYESAFKTFRTP